MVYCGLGIIIYRLREEAAIIWEEGDSVIALKAVYFASQLFSPLILNGQRWLFLKQIVPANSVEKRFAKLLTFINEWKLGQRMLNTISWIGVTNLYLDMVLDRHISHFRNWHLPNMTENQLSADKVGQWMAYSYQNSVRMSGLII